MASIEQIRNASEAKLASKMRGLSRKHRTAIRNAIKQYGGLANIPNTFWQDLEKQIQDETAALLALLYIAAHETTANKLRFQSDEQETRRKAQEYAVMRSKALALSHIENTQKRLSGRLEALRGKIQTVADEQREAEKQLATILSDDRADVAAVTETTTGISTGQIGGAEDYEQENPQDLVQYKWRTERDERVCPICNPLDGKLSETWTRYFPGGPPAHPRCRCQLILYVKRGAVSTKQGRRLSDIPLEQRVARLPELTRTINQIRK